MKLIKAGLPVGIVSLVLVASTQAAQTRHATTVGHTSQSNTQVVNSRQTAANGSGTLTQSQTNILVNHQSGGSSSNSTVTTCVQGVCTTMHF